MDDQPQNNRFEIAALAKLQIEVVAVKSTTDALKHLEEDEETFDLVLSDWSRPKESVGESSAGINFLRLIRTKKHDIPFVFYHGVFDAKKREARRKVAIEEGAIGEAVKPDELIALLVKILGKK